MDRSDVCYLIKKEFTQDDYGVERKTETRRQVFCKVRSVSHSEKIDNGLMGLFSAYQLSIFRFDYDMEETVEYNGMRYSVYDATEYNDQIRLNIKREQGA